MSQPGNSRSKKSVGMPMWQKAVALAVVLGVVWAALHFGLGMF